MSKKNGIAKNLEVVKAEKVGYTAPPWPKKESSDANES